MNYGLWLSAAGMQVNEYRQAILANNMANVDTVGFKHDLAVIQERAVESRTSSEGSRYRDPLFDGLTGGPWVRPTVHSVEQGPLTHTGRSLDVAIDGAGYLTVRDGDELRYTRDGQFTINADRELVSVAGGGRIRILDDTGNPILVRGDDVSIGSDGTVYSDGTPVARLGLVDVDDAQKLRKVGKNLFDGPDVQTRPAAGRVRSEFIERSTASPVTSLATMIEVSRAYELNARMVTLQDTLNGQAVSRLGRIG